MTTAFLMGCSSSYNSVSQSDGSIAYLQLSGDFLEHQIQIDEQTPIQLTEDTISTFEIDGKTVTKFEISSGTHRVKLSRSGVTIIDRKIYVTSGNTFEVLVQ
jgi:predicted Ser/Thr protein kinase